MVKVKNFIIVNRYMTTPPQKYTLVCNKKANVGVLYSTDIVTSNVTIFPYVIGDIYSHYEIPDNTDENYISFLLGQQPETIGNFITSNYEIDFTTDTFLYAYRRWTLQSIIQERNKKLIESDWTQVNDNGLSDELKEAWRVYRQALRDLPTTYDLENPLWPEPPQ